MIKFIEKENALAMYPKVMDVSSFITAGLVDYSDAGDGRYLLKKETIDKMLSTLEGRPVVMGHQKITEDNIDDLAVGYVLGGNFNPETGQYDCKIIVKDTEIVNAIKSGHNKVSSAYEPTEFGDGGTYSGLSYDAEIKNGVFTHLAIVDTPRYTDAKILTNNYEGQKMFKRLFKNEKQNEEIREFGICDNDLIEVEGATVSIGELKAAFLEKQNACKNEVEEEKKEEVKEEEKEEEKENCSEKKNEEVEVEETEEVKEKENEVEEEEKKEEKEEEKEEVKEKQNEDESARLKEMVRAILREEMKDVHNCSEKSNSLRMKALTRPQVDESEGYETRADRIKASNEKYSK